MSKLDEIRARLWRYDNHKAWNDTDDNIDFHSHAKENIAFLLAEVENQDSLLCQASKEFRQHKGENEQLREILDSTRKKLKGIGFLDPLVVEVVNEIDKQIELSRNDLRH